MQYAIVSGSSQFVQDQVNQRLQVGWVLLGAPFIDSGIMYQAMTYSRD